MTAAISRSSGRLVLVGGEAGVGKSALIREFLAGLPSGPLRLVGACEALSAPRPLGPVLDFSHLIGDEFKALAEAGDQRQQIFSLLLSVRSWSRRMLSGVCAPEILSGRVFRSCPGD